MASTIKPGLALGGWTAFKPMHDGVMVMGDLVLLGNEINPVIGKLHDGGLEITAVHNHLLRAEPVDLLHACRRPRRSREMATTIHDALATTQDADDRRRPPARRPPSISTRRSSIRSSASRATNKGGIYGFAVPRRDPVKEEGIEIVPAGAMGVATGINFQPTGGGKAAITGDFVMIGDEVNPVITALRSNGIEITALHSHMIGEQPRLFFMHFWANDDALKLAKGLRAALDKMASVMPDNTAGMSGAVGSFPCAGWWKSLGSGERLRRVCFSSFATNLARAVENCHDTECPGSGRVSWTKRDRPRPATVATSFSLSQRTTA